MTESGAHESMQGIETLRQAGADKFDPVRFYYLDVLARRATLQQGPVKRLLHDKLAQALVTLRENFERERNETQQAVGQVVPHYPQAAVELQRLHDGGDFTAVRQRISRLKDSVHGTPLGEMTSQLLQNRSQGAEVSLKGHTAVRPALNATQYFRNTWAKLSIEKRVAQALGKAPMNAGPINSHMLVLRSLALMRDISPDYLNRMTAYVDTLLCLDKCEKQKQATTRTTGDAGAGKRTKSRPARGQR